MHIRNQFIISKLICITQNDSSSDFEAGEDGDDSSGGGNSWREELQRRYQQENDFLAELRARNVTISQTPSATPSSEQEQERGEREEADGEKEDENETNWTEPAKKWVNR